MENTILFYSEELGPQRRTQNSKIKVTEKLIVTNAGQLKKAKLTFYTLADQSLSESQKTKAFYMLDNVFYYNGHVLENGETIAYDKKEKHFLIGDEIVSYGEFEDIFRSEIGLRVS